MSAQHTPGPWVIHKHGLGSPYLCNVVREWQQDGITYMRIITIQLKYDTPEVNEANAQLIAAAPELLEQLKLAHRMLLQTNWIHEDEAMNELLAVIRKAEGI